MGGIVIYMFKIFIMFSSFLMVLLVLFGMSGFVVEFLVFLGIVVSNKYLFNFKIFVIIIEVIGIILIFIYLLLMLC